YKAGHPEFTIPGTQLQAVRVHVSKLRTLLRWRQRLLDPAHLFARGQVRPGKTVKPFECYKKPFLVPRDAQRTHRSVESHRLLEGVALGEVELLYQMIADGSHVHVPGALRTVAIVRPGANVQCFHH